jgi:hypothetical protein
MPKGKMLPPHTKHHTSPTPHPKAAGRKGCVDDALPTINLHTSWTRVVCATGDVAQKPATPFVGKKGRSMGAVLVKSKADPLLAADVVLLGAAEWWWCEVC